MVNFPSWSVEVPPTNPRITTLTPGSVSPVEASITVPDTVTDAPVWVTADLSSFTSCADSEKPSATTSIMIIIFILFIF
jgi:hypothetical protein